VVEEDDGEVEEEVLDEVVEGKKLKDEENDHDELGEEKLKDEENDHEEEGDVVVAEEGGVVVVEDDTGATAPCKLTPLCMVVPHCTATITVRKTAMPSTSPEDCFCILTK